MHWRFGGHCTWYTQTAPRVTSVFCKRAVPGQSNQGSSCRRKLEQTRSCATRPQNTETRMGKAGWFWVKCFIKTMLVNTSDIIFQGHTFLYYYCLSSSRFSMACFPITRFRQMTSWIKIFHHSFIHVPNKYLLGASSVLSTALGPRERETHLAFLEQAVSLPEDAHTWKPKKDTSTKGRQKEQTSV